MEVTNGLKVACKHPEGLVFAYLLQVSLRKAFVVLPIFLVRSFENRLTVFTDYFALDDWLVPLGMVAKMQLVGPFIRLLPGTDIDRNADSRKFPCVQRADLAHAAADCDRVLETFSRYVAQKA